MSGSHENFQRPDAVKRSSDRTFGLVFAAFFALVALLPLLHRHPMRAWGAGLSALFLLVALLAPNALAPLNRIWTELGVLLHRVVNPIIMGVFFYVVFTPVSLVLRLLGKDFLRQKAAPDAGTYWISRQPPGPEPESLANQF